MLSRCFIAILFNLYIRESRRFKNHKKGRQGQDKRIGCCIEGVCIVVRIATLCSNIILFNLYSLVDVKTIKQEGRGTPLAMNINVYK